MAGLGALSGDEGAAERPRITGRVSSYVARAAGEYNAAPDAWKRRLQHATGEHRSGGVDRSASFARPSIETITRAWVERPS